METQLPASTNGALNSQKLYCVTLAFNSMGNELIFIINPRGWMIQMTEVQMEETYLLYRSNQLSVGYRVMRKRDFRRILGRLIAQELLSSSPDRMVFEMTPTGIGNGYVYERNQEVTTGQRQQLELAFPHLLSTN
jgi:hypothetical protein